MPGAILQLVANNGAHQNIWLDNDPDITFFKKIYRRHTPFSLELIDLPITQLDFGTSGKVTIQPKGDLVHRMFYSFDIPFMAAAFLNLKTSDFTKAILDSSLSDEVLEISLRKILSKDEIEVGPTIDLIESTLACYNNEERIRLIINEQLNQYKDPIGYSTVSVYNPGTDSFILDPNVYGFVDFKMNLASLWLNQKKGYALIYNYLKYMFDENRNNILNAPVLNTAIVSNLLLYSSVFNNILPNREILAMFYIKNLNYNIVTEQSTNSLIETFDILMTTFYENLFIDKDIPLTTPFRNNYEYYQFINSIFSANPVQVNDPDFDINTTATDTHTLLQKMAFVVNDQFSALQTVQSQFYNYGPSFYYILNAYNTIINVLNGLATTVPIIVVKAFNFAQTPVNIYTDLASTTLTSTVNPTIIDPNFKASFNFEIDNENIQKIYGSDFVNQYLQLILNQASYLFNNMEQGINSLFERYRSALFTNTTNLFFNNVPPLQDIYSYIVPQQGFQEDASKRISNVFNANIWFFYFFQYLDTFNEHNFSNYVINHTTLYDLNSNEQLFLSSIITLLKINLEYYMNEISYMLNDLYARAPSMNPNDTMKNYVPKSYGTTLNGVNITTDLLGVTLVFHRNHVQTILELFQYIYYFIDNITIQQINVNLLINIAPIFPAQINRIRRMVKLLYYTIFQYFMNVYDSFKFEPAANFSMDEFNQTDTSAIKNYVNYFFNNTYVPDLRINEVQQPLNEVIAQMEFYFVAEMLNMRELEKFYYNTVFNEELIVEQIGSTTATIIKMVKDFFFAFINPIDLNKVSCTDRVRNYWDLLYRTPNDLYYETFNLERYYGLPYDLTSYQSRDFGIVVAPIDPPVPLPPTDPYGINSIYYNNRPVPSELDEYIPVYWTGTPNTFYNTKNDSTEFQLFEIDYFRIKHSVLHLPPLIVPPSIVYIDEYQMDLLEAINLTKQLIKTFPIMDQHVLDVLYPILNFLYSETIPTVPYTEYLGIYNLGPNLTFSYLLFVYKGNPLDLNLLTEALNGLNEIFFEFHNGMPVQVAPQAAPYTYADLVRNNLYTYNVLIDNVNINSNIIQKVILARDNFLSEYFYYVKYENSIVNIQNMNVIGNTNLNVESRPLIDKSFYFLNDGQITYEVLNQTNYNDVDLTPLQRSSTLIFFYPNAFATKVNEILAMVDQLDDFSYNIAAILLQIVSPNTAPRYTIKDIYDIINNTFRSIKQGYAYAADNGFFDFIYETLEFYQPSLLNKILLFNEIYEYTSNIPRNEFMTTVDVANIANMVVNYGINYEDYYNYLLTEILPTFNSMIIDPLNNYSFQRDTFISTKLESNLDYFFIKWIIGDTDIPQYILFQTYIIEDIFNVIDPVENEILLLFFSLVRNSDYGYIFIFYNYIVTNNIPLTNVTNPISQMNKNNLLVDQDIISLYYRNFYSLSDPLEYFMDLVWDWTMTLCNRDPYIISNDFGYGHRMTVTVNQIHLETILNALEKNISINNNLRLIYEGFIREKRALIERANIHKYFKRKCAGLTPEKKCVNEIIGFDIFVDTEKYVNSSDYYFDILAERDQIVEFIRDVCCRGIVLINTQRKEIEKLQNSLYNIFYRNKRAKMAWIRKLAHFLVKEIIIRNDDQILDAHPSDWLEIFHEVSKADGSDYGYNKMIGYRKDLIIYDDKLKNTYNIILPFVFYCNRNVMAALPLNASLNTTYEVTITLRPLNEITYKEQFSDFIDPTLYFDLNNPDLKPFIPQIFNSKLTAEYVYLTTEERTIFVNNALEYIMEEIQDDNGFNVTDSNLIPVYKMGTDRITTVLDGRIETIYDPAKGVYIDQEELDNITLIDYRPGVEQLCPKKCPKIPELSQYSRAELTVPLIPRSDLVPTRYVGQIGAPRIMMVNQPLTEVDPFVHFKRINYRYYFNNPSELLTMVVKMDIHTQPNARENERNYFYGEYQWDNYSLYSYNDLSTIYDAKKEYYLNLQDQLNDPDNDTYGFITVINRLIIRYARIDPSLITNQWISNNYSEFMATLHRIKEAYLSYTGIFLDYLRIIRIKENLMYLRANYDIYQADFLFQLVTDVYDQLNLIPPTDLEIIGAYTLVDPLFNINNFILTRVQFREGLNILLNNQIQQDLVTRSQICEAVDIIYSDYNESQINFLISSILDFYDINLITYNFVNFMDYYYAIYSLKNDADSVLLAMLIKINDAIKLLTTKEVAFLDDYPIQDIFYKNIIYQVVPIIPIINVFDNYLTLIPFIVLNTVAKEMNREENVIINTTPVALINYEENIRPNPRVNPLIRGNLTFNSYDLMPDNAEGIVWSELEAYLYLLHTPSTGINLHSWSLFPLLSQGQGSANLSRIDEFRAVYDLHPIIGDKFPATIRTILLSVNLLRVMSGLTGKAWEFGSFKNS